MASMATDYRVQQMTSQHSAVSLWLPFDPWEFDEAPLRRKLFTIRGQILLPLLGF